MRRFCLFLALCLTLALPVSAVSGISGATNETVVDENGTCQVTMTVTLVLEEAQENLTFPLPAQARDIKINGVNAKAPTAGGTRNVDLSDIVAGIGTFTLTFHYSLPDAVAADSNGKLFLTLPLLSGFALPVENLRFTVSLPGTPEEMPTFSSTYYLESMDSLVEVTLTKNAINGAVLVRLQDREALSMVLPVTEEMFPQSIAKSWSMDSVDLLMIGTAVLALIYWLIALRSPRTEKLRKPMAPEGITAGDVACRLTGQGVDLTLMVLSWAQMGYILIQLDDNGRVLLHKRMDMGNERSDFENRFFKNLFGRKKIADATGYHYARLCRKAKATVSGRKQTYEKGAVGPRVFRALAAVVGALAGVSLALEFVGDTAWRVFLGILLGLLGLVCVWLIQSGAKSVYNRQKLPLLIAAAAALVWLLLSLAAGEVAVALIVIVLEFLAGIGAFFGGRRTVTGRQMTAELLGLRRYLRTAEREELKRLLRLNPHYYYDLAPFALALDADRAFARQMGKTRLPQCDYLTTGMDGHMTAREWNLLLQDTVHAMDALQLRLPLERLLGK